MNIFKQTSNDPYVRHDYKLTYADGHTVIFDNYEDLMSTWFSTPGFLLDYVEVLDHKEKRGFKK